MMMQTASPIAPPPAIEAQTGEVSGAYRLLNAAGRELARNVILHPCGKVFGDARAIRSPRWLFHPENPNLIFTMGTVWSRAQGQLESTDLQPPPIGRFRARTLRATRTAQPDAQRLPALFLRRQSPVPDNRNDFEIVVAKYKEDVAWTQCYPNNVTIYCKDPDDRRFIPLPNIGREYGTYLYHIVSRYETLSRKTLFLQADPFFHWLLPICNYASPREGFTSELNLHQSMEQVVTWSWPDQKVDANVKADFLRKLERSPDITDYRFTYGAQFAVSRGLIRSQPKSYYQKLYEISQLQEIRLAGRSFDNLHIGFMFEFFWENIFCPKVFNTTEGPGNEIGFTGERHAEEKTPRPAMTD